MPLLATKGPYALKISYDDTATNSVKMLTEAGILQQESAGMRNRLFSYYELVDLFVGDP